MAGRPRRLDWLCGAVTFAFGMTAGSPGVATAAQHGPRTTAPQVVGANHHDASPPLWLLPPASKAPPRDDYEPKRFRPPLQGNAPAPADPVLQAQAPPALMPSVLVNVDGVGQGFTGPAGTFSVNSAPPDTNGDIGPNHYVQIVNTDFAIFDRSGTPLFGPVPVNTLWSGFGGDCQANNDGDPIALYDPIADRWIVSQFSVTGANGTTRPFLQCVAVSQTPDPTGAYFRYSFPYTGFPDYPKFGVWPDAYYVTFNMFNASGTAFLGAKACAYDRARILQGQSATQQCFNTSTSFGGLLPADLDGARLPPAGAPNPVVALGITDASGNGNTLAAWKFHVDWSTPANSTFSGPTTLPVAAYQTTCGSGSTCIPQSGGGSLDSLSDRLMYRLAYRNFADGHQSLVVNHAVTAGTGGGVRWYELRLDSAGNPSVFQQGTFAPDAGFRWMGSIAQDQDGNMALGYSVSSSSLKPSIRHTGRLASDPAGQMTQGEGEIIAGAGAQGSSLSRWGDYSMMAVDPADDCTFWYTTEYIPANGTFNWRTRVASFVFPECGATASNDFSIGASPVSITVSQGGTGTSTISTAVLSGSAETVALSIAGVPAGASASFSPSSVTAGGSAVLTVNAGTAGTGSYTLTVTGTAASATHSTTVALTVTGPPDFTMAVSPASRTVAAGGSTTYTVSTTALNGSTQTIALSVSGLPSGVTGSFSPATVIAGGSSTLTLATSLATPPATATFSATGTSGRVTHAASASLTVTLPPPNDFSIAVSPASNTVAAGSSTQATVLTTLVSGVPETISLSVSGLPSGVTGSFNPATTTSGGTSTLTLSASAAAPSGAATFTVTGTSASATRSANASVTVGPGDGTIVLANGVPVTGISGATGSQKFYVLSVPAGQASLKFTISGGTGDADLYVRFGSKPTTSTYNCRPFLNGNTETCTFNNPAAGNWYVMLRGFTAYSGVTLTGTYAVDTTPQLTNGVPVTGISGASASQQFWKLAVPASRPSVTFTISGGAGDADLYVRFGSKPTTAAFNCRPFLNGNNETCTFNNPAAGDWFVMIRGFTAYSGVTLKGTY